MTVKRHAIVITPRIFYQTVAKVASILFPKYPCYYFPSFLLIQIYNKLIDLKNNPKFRLIPIPNKFYEILTRREFIKCDHYCFISDRVYDKYVTTENLNWINVTFFNEPTSSSGEKNRKYENDIVHTILSKQNSAILMPVIPTMKCQSNCVFVNENCYQNLCAKYKVTDTKKVPFVQLQCMSPNQFIPRLANKATIYLIKNPYDLPMDVTDEILNKYFTTPRILYRNHTYEIILDQELLGITLFSQFFHIFANLKKIFFRCMSLESNDNSLETTAVVVKGVTTLSQSNSINYPVPKQILDDLCFITTCPWGLMQFYNDLKSCIIPFVGDMNIASSSPLSRGQSPAMKASSRLTSNHILPAFLLQGERGSGKHRVVTAVAQSLGFQQMSVDCAEVVSQIPAQTETKLKLVLAKANMCEPMFLVLHNFELFGVDHEGREDLRILAMFQKELHDLFAKERNYPIIIVALSNAVILKPTIQRQFLEVIKLEPANKDERYNNLEWMLHKELISQEVINNRSNIEINVPLYNGTTMNGAKASLAKYYKFERNNEILQEVADKTQGFLYGDLKLLFENSVKDLLVNHEDLSITDSCLKMENFDKELNAMQADFSDSLGAPKVPKVLWSDIGGLIKLKDEIQSSIGLPLKHMHLMGKNMRRSGILLYGPPGTGKTLVAKAVATECNLSFLSVQGPELLNMYVGQSEQNVREVFERARSAAPCVIFLDELDSLAPNRGASGDSGGVMDRVVSQLLAEMDEMTSDSEPEKQIFVLAATNRPDLIDPALLRPGRFDKLFYVGPCITKGDKAAVLTAQMKKFNLDPSLTIDSIAELLVDDMTGADIYSICSNAWLSAVRRTIINNHNEKTGLTNDITSEDVIVNLEDFQKATMKFIPSINKKDLEYFNKLRLNYSLEEVSQN